MKEKVARLHVPTLVPTTRPSRITGRAFFNSLFLWVSLDCQHRLFSAFQFAFQGITYILDFAAPKQGTRQVVPI